MASPLRKVHVHTLASMMAWTAAAPPAIASSRRTNGVCNAALRTLVTTPPPGASWPPIYRHHLVLLGRSPWSRWAEPTLSFLGSLSESSPVSSQRSREPSELRRHRDRTSTTRRRAASDSHSRGEQRSGVGTEPWILGHECSQCDPLINGTPDVGRNNGVGLSERHASDDEELRQINRGNRCLLYTSPSPRD